ncbi:MAG: hypothetical protein RL227_2161, partial [Pseudomonadota bacterium]
MICKDLFVLKPGGLGLKTGMCELYIHYKSQGPRPGDNAVAEVKLAGVGKAYGDVKILKGIDLHIRDGEFMVFVG